MQLPTASTPVSRCHQLSLFTQAMLRGFPGSAALVANADFLADATTPLLDAESALQDAQVQLILKRAEVVITDHNADMLVRDVHRAVEGVDGKRGGRSVKRVFPGGLGAVTSPKGSKQIESMVALKERLMPFKDSMQDGDALMGQLESTITTYQQIVSARDTLEQAISTLRIQRDDAKEYFRDAFAQIKARIQDEFPRDTKTQNLFFDAVRAKKTKDKNDNNGG